MASRGRNSPSGAVILGATAASVFFEPKRRAAAMDGSSRSHRVAMEGGPAASLLLDAKLRLPHNPRGNTFGQLLITSLRSFRDAVAMQLSGSLFFSIRRAACSARCRAMIVCRIRLVVFSRGPSLRMAMGYPSSGRTLFGSSGAIRRDAAGAAAPLPLDHRHRPTAVSPKPRSIRFFSTVPCRFPDMVYMYTCELDASDFVA